MSFAEKGAVGDIHPAFFIGFLHGQKATGTLKFEEGSVQRAIYFREGRVLFSSSNAPEDQLGAILVAAGKISQEKFDSIVASLEPKQSIAAALSQGGHVSQRDIGDAARRKVEQIIGSCCAQTVGQYEFEDGVLPKGALDLKLTTEKVLISAFEVLEPSGFLIRILKSPVAVLARTAVEPTDPELARMRDALDGVSPLADIGGTLGLPLAATEARAAALVVLGAASVVTSQIEAMTLPDTGEASPEISGSELPDDSEQIEAETIAFGQSPEVAETIAFGDMSAEPVGDIGADAAVAPPSGEAPQSSPDDTIDTGTRSGMAGVISPPPRPSSPAKTQRATTQDLDAVKELLGTPAKGAPRPGSASIPSKRWDPVLSSQGRPGRAVKQSPVVKSVIAVVLLAVVGLGGWLAYLAQSSPAPRTAAASPTPQPSPSLAAADPAADPAAPPSSAPTTAASSAAPGKPLPAPAAAATRPASTGPALTATPAPRATEKPAAAPTPTSTVNATPAPAGAPAVARAPSVARTGAPGGFEALKAGRLAEAAAGFEAVAQTHSAEFSVQLLVACSPQTIEKAVQNDPSPDLFILPATIAGKPCHRLMRGFFKTTAEATQAVATLPAYYTAEGAKPKAIPLKSVLR